jgi:hypothetical protein
MMGALGPDMALAGGMISLGMSLFGGPSAA